MLCVAARNASGLQSGQAAPGPRCHPEGSRGQLLRRATRQSATLGVGFLGVPRDWTATVAGRTLADLVLQEDIPLTRLPWLGRRVRRWEPEPLRWLGVQGMYALYPAADRNETNGDMARSSRLARVANVIISR